MSTIIMIHGFGACSTQWKFLSDHLTADHLSIHTIDLLGHGNGFKSSIRTDYSIESTFEKLIVDINSIAHDEIILIGHSLGGYLSLMFAHQYPERVKNLVLINPLFTKEQVGPGLKIMNQLGKLFYTSEDRFPNRLVKFGYELSKITHPDISDEVRNTFVEGAGYLSPKVLYLLDTFSDLTDIISGIQTPTLLIWGDQDRTLHPELYPHLAELLNPSKIYIFDNEDHYPHLIQPKVVGETINEFLNLSNH